MDNLKDSCAEFYSSLFAPFRDQAIQFLAISPSESSRIPFWEGFFRKAEISSGRKDLVSPK